MIPSLAARCLERLRRVFPSVNLMSDPGISIMWAWIIVVGVALAVLSAAALTVLWALGVI
jgi:hypothetical protein